MIGALDPPDFRTISDFRKRHLKALGALFLQVLQGRVIAARTAASSFATPVANEATRLARARSIHGVRPASALRRIIMWNSEMISRASTRVGTPASIAATVTVSAFESKFRPIVMRRAIVLADGIR